MRLAHLLAPWGSLAARCGASESAARARGSRDTVNTMVTQCARSGAVPCIIRTQMSPGAWWAGALHGQPRRWRHGGSSKACRAPSRARPGRRQSLTVNGGRRCTHSRCTPDRPQPAHVAGSGSRHGRRGESRCWRAPMCVSRTAQARHARKTRKQRAQAGSSTRYRTAPKESTSVAVRLLRPSPPELAVAL